VRFSHEPKPDPDEPRSRSDGRYLDDDFVPRLSVGRGESEGVGLGFEGGCHVGCERGMVEVEVEAEVEVGDEEKWREMKGDEKIIHFRVFLTD
jgi:hypothetical protein